MVVVEAVHHRRSVASDRGDAAVRQRTGFGVGIAEARRALRRQLAALRRERNLSVGRIDDPGRAISSLHLAKRRARIEPEAVIAGIAVAIGGCAGRLIGLGLRALVVGIA